MGSKAQLGTPICRGCHYELASLMQASETGRCPECGHPWDRNAPFTLRRKPSLLALFWTGSGPTAIIVTCTGAVAWITAALDIKIVGIVAFAFGGLAAFFAALMGPIWVLARGRDERLDTTLRWWTPIAVSLLTLACNAVMLKTGVDFIARRLG